MVECNVVQCCVICVCGPHADTNQDGWDDDDAPNALEEAIIDMPLKKNWKKMGDSTPSSSVNSPVGRMCVWMCVWLAPSVHQSIL